MVGIKIQMRDKALSLSPF